MLRRQTPLRQCYQFFLSLELQIVSTDFEVALLEFQRQTGSESGMLVWLRKMTSAECRKMTVFQGIFRSEGTLEGRGQQQHQHTRVAADRGKYR